MFLFFVLYNFIYPYQRKSFFLSKKKKKVADLGNAASIFCALSLKTVAVIVTLLLAIFANNIEEVPNSDF